MNILNWISDNYIEIFGAVAGILYVFLEIRQNIWLWPVGIITSAVYIWVFFTGKLYADMSLQVYYLAISVIGWYWWLKGTGHSKAISPLEGVNQTTITSPLEGVNQTTVTSPLEGVNQTTVTSPLESLSRPGGRGSGGVSESSEKLKVTRLNLKTGIILAVVFALLYIVMWQVLDRFTDSPVPEWDSFITSLSVIATWMLARKIYEHWYLWIIVNIAASLLFFRRGLYPTVLLYVVYCAMSFAGLNEWKKDIKEHNN